MTEADLRRSTRALLEALQSQGKILFGQHVSSMRRHEKDSETGKWKMLVSKEGAPPVGQPDFWVYIPAVFEMDLLTVIGIGQMLFLELKAPGKKPSKEQKTWLTRAREAGSAMAVCETFEQVEEALGKVGMET